MSIPHHIRRILDRYPRVTRCQNPKFPCPQSLFHPPIIIVSHHSAAVRLGREIVHRAESLAAVHHPGNRRVGGTGNLVEGLLEEGMEDLQVVGKAFLVKEDRRGRVALACLVHQELNLVRKRTCDSRNGRRLTRNHALWWWHAWHTERWWDTCVVKSA